MNERTSRRLGVPYRDEVGVWLSLRIEPPKVGRGRSHARALDLAHFKAREAGHKVIGIVGAAEQNDGGWIVELQIADKEGH